GQVYQVFLTIECLDRINLLADVGNMFGESKTNITSVRTQSHSDKTATLELAIEVRDTQHLAQIMQKVRGMGDILDIRRATAIRKEPRLK
ncbi:MAG TPA: ACT domain-containing protein, partial [Chthonomonadaceae bacterium]|nr:ACT domain-containing protein [Chthonomonadaceae bacterium]